MATFKFRVRLTMSFIITRLAVSLLDSTFVPRRVYKFLCLFSLCFLRMCVFSFFFIFTFIGGTHTTYAFGIPKKLLLVWSVCVFWVSAGHVSYVWRRTHTCIHMSRIKTIYHLAYQARPNVHYFADAMRRIVF